ncbi:YARHG domain-containing protein [Oceanirhabdus sp. W0125-5]|uniref:YARHG domain-containing protein n=1 Tax=Oceanirhabdus sp. W0125-5 TaxID=2999116 RepID=UPI0022F2D27F|nr:YARHG domain-containing protein [Oceanirhabdus sp. W0125-5]WBW97070.1 YARHG domain-containing protein [Oceanirhabdus sp. W0125-5]
MKKLIVIAIIFVVFLGSCNNDKNNPVNSIKGEINIESKESNEETDEKKINQGNHETMETSESIDNKNDTNKEDEYVLSFSSERKLTDQDIYDLMSKYRDLDREGIDLAKNEIFARHGYVFKQNKYKEYFSNKSWYIPKENMSMDELTELEWYNINFLIFIENRHFPQSYIESSQNDNNRKIIKNHPYEIYNSNEVVYCDLNDDGVEEKILYEKVYAEYNEYYLSINDEKVEVPGGDGFETFAIVDIDENDKFKEIIVSDSGPSEDYTSVFYRYDGEVIQIGNTEGAYGDMIFSGDGIFVTRTRGEILHTWFYKDTFILEEGIIRNIPQELYYMGACVFVLNPVTLYKNREKTEKGITLNEGQIVKISYTDNKEWCLVERENGEKGWFYLEDNYYINDTGHFPAEYFYGLCFAD